jgi:hypothetical protein
MYMYRDIEMGYRFGYKKVTRVGTQVSQDDSITWRHKNHDATFIPGNCLIGINLLPFP